MESRRSITERTWAYLEEMGFLEVAVEEIGNAESDPVGYLVEEIDRILAAAPDTTTRAMPAGGIPYSRAFGYLEEYERERVEARSETLAKYAAANELVRVFRDRFMGGEPLSKQPAETFANSPAAANLPTQWFEENGVPFVDHNAQVSSIEFRGWTEVWEFVIDPPGTIFRVERGPKMPEYKNRELIIVGGLRFKQPGLTTLVRSGSPLDELRKVGRHLCKQSSTWKYNYATRFVLTGEPPEESPLWMERGSGGEIVMHVAPWISPENVKNAYMRELWFREWMNEHYGGSKAKRRRRLSDKNLRLLRFITDRVDNRGRVPKDRGAEVAAEWDAEYPEWAYRGNTRGMWRDYNRALREVVPEVTRKGHR